MTAEFSPGLILIVGALLIPLNAGIFESRLYDGAPHCGLCSDFDI